MAHKKIDQFKKKSAHDRQQEILKILRNQSSIKFSELSELLSVTEMTIRRDIEKLAKENNLQKTIGGAILNEEVIQLDLNNRLKLMFEEKCQIGKLAASLIKPKDVVYIDAGTTTLQVAKQIASKDVTVITNAPNIALELHKRGVLTILLGGQLDASTLSAIGPITVGNIENMNFKSAFISTAGISINGGLTNANYFELQVKQLAIKKAKEVNVVVDSSKFNKDSLVSFAKLEEIDRIITNQDVSNEFKIISKKLGIEILIA